MEGTGHVSVADFREAFTPLHLKTLQIIHIAMALGVLVLFAAILFLFALRRDGASPPQVDLIRLLSFVHLAVAVIAYRMSGYFFDRLLARHGHPAAMGWTGPAGSPGPEGDPVARIVQAFKAAYIARLAIIEGVAFLGLTVCLLGAMFGVLQREPLYWLNAATTLIMLWFITTHFPTRDRLEGIFREKIR